MADTGGTIKNKDLKDYVDDILNRRRSYYEPIWYSSLHGYDNNHFVGWSQTSKSIQLYPTRKRFFIQFPETKRQVDGFQNLLMASNPVYQVYPTDYSDKSQQDDAKFQSLFLKQHYLDWHEDNVLHTMVHNAGVMPISFMEMAITREWSIEENKYIWTTVPRSYDAFDIGFDPLYLFEDNPCVFKIIRTTTDRISRSRLYKDFNGRQVTSLPQDYKEIYYIDKFGNSTYHNSNRVLLAECHIKDGEDIRIVTIDGQGTVLRETRIKGMPFYSIIPFQPSSGFSYQPSLAENLLPINRSMDLTGNRLESMTMKYVKGSYLMPASTTVSMSDEDGTLLTYKGAVAPTVLKNPDVPEWAWSYVNFMQSASDRYGTNPVTLGGVPKGSNMRSGKMMDKTNQNTLLMQKMFMDNFTYTLKRSAEVMVYLESKLLTQPRNYTLQSSSQDYESKKFVGADYYEAFKSDPGVVPLPKSFRKLSVEIEDETTHGIEAKRATFERFAKVYGELKQQAPELVPEGLALFLKTGDIANVMSEAAKQGTLLGAEALNNIVENNRMGVYDGDPEFKKAVQVVMQRLAQDPSLEKPMSNMPIQTRGKDGKPVFSPPQSSQGQPSQASQPNQEQDQG